METPVRDRLTGAIILGAVIVLLVPELLSGPRPARVPAATPADAAPVRQVVIDLPPDLHRAPARSEPPSAASNRPPEPPGSVQPVPGDAPSAVTPPTLSAPQSPAHAAAAAPRPSPAVAVEPASDTQASNRAAGHAGGRWTVQLGSFGKRVNAEMLVRQLQAKGIPASLAAVKSRDRTLWRVRAGGVSDRPAAERLAARVRAAGHSAVLVPG